MLEYIKPLFRWRWAVIRRGQRAWHRLRPVVARLWRPLLYRTTFIVVCGSVGKTTTKEVLAAVLSQRFRVSSTSGTWNTEKFGGISGTILRVRPWHRFAIVEAGIASEGDMTTPAVLIKPDIVLMLGIKECHLMMFKTLERVAAEKAEMLRALGPDGIAVLNADDPLVKAMASVGNFRVAEFGTQTPALRVKNASASWPERLSCTLTTDAGDYVVKTQLVGEHWLPTILAVVTTALQCGMQMQEIVTALEQVEPFWARMQPITLKNGVTYLRDEWNGSYDTFVEAIKVMRDARGVRRIAVISDYSDSHNSSKPRQKVKRMAREMAAGADVMICVGERAEFGRQAAIEAGLPESNVYAAYDTREASDILKRVQRAGDLVLIKGRTSHHLSRVYLDQIGPVSCTLDACSRQYLCDRCGELGFAWRAEDAGLRAPPELIV